MEQELRRWAERTPPLRAVKRAVRRALEVMPFFGSLRTWFLQSRNQAILAEWERSGRPVPPPHVVKQQALLDYAGEFGLQVLVETGTFYGDMVEAMRGRFDRVYSIELSERLYKVAKARFKRAQNVELIHGDSGQRLGQVVGKLDQPALFWLDGHYSGGITARGAKDAPIYEELASIFGGRRLDHVVLIDDARILGADPAWPTLADLTAFVKAHRPDLAIQVHDDIVRITPAKPA
jgi:hypothetical protein